MNSVYFNGIRLSTIDFNLNGDEKSCKITFPFRVRRDSHVIIDWFNDTGTLRQTSNHVMTQDHPANQEIELSK